MTKKKDIENIFIGFVESFCKLFTVLAIIFIVFYLLPAALIGIVNFLKLVVFGEFTRSEFLASWQGFSLERVNLFYSVLADRLLGVYTRLTS